MTLKLGKRPATHDPRDLRYATLRMGLSAAGKIPSAPAIFGHGNSFHDWGMLGNDTCGDCAWAGPAHETMELASTTGRRTPRFTAENVISQYSEYSGYDQETGANDNGSNVRDVLAWRRSKGLRDADGGVHKIGAYIALEPGNLQHIIEAAWLFDCVGIGFEVPSSAMNQFEAGEPWSVVPGSEVEGGHYVPIVGRPAPGELACITWGRRQVLTDAFFSKYTDESWAYLTPERYRIVTGKSYEGFNAAQLEAYLQLVVN